jgi:hypothetical protein
MMIYTPNISTYYNLSKKNFRKQMGLGYITTYFKFFKRPRYLYIKSNLLHIYYYTTLNKNYFSFFYVAHSKKFLV